MKNSHNYPGIRRSPVDTAVVKTTFLEKIEKLFCKLSTAKTTTRTRLKMSKTYFDGSACVDGNRQIPYSTLEIHGGSKEGLLGDHEGWCWLAHDYSSLNKCEKVAILKGRGCPGWTARRVSDIDEELLRQDEYVFDYGIKNAIAAVRYKNTPVLSLYAEARQRGFGSTEKCRDEIETWLIKDDQKDLRRRREHIILKAAKALHSGKIDLTEFNARCAATKELY